MRCVCWVTKTIGIHAEYQFCSLVAQKHLLSQGVHFMKALRSHSDTPQSVGLLWTSDQPDAVTPT